MFNKGKTAKTRGLLQILVVEGNDFLRQLFDTTLKAEYLIHTAANATKG